MNPKTKPNTRTAATYWFLVIGTERKGPLTEAQLQTMISQGVVTRTTLVWCNGMPTWASAETSELSYFFDLPPPLPDAHNVTALAECPVALPDMSSKSTEVTAARDVEDPDIEAIGEAEWSSKPRPWTRYAARMIDTYCVGAALGMFYWIITAELLENAYFISIAAVAITMLVEPFLLSTWGWTPGKSLMCVRVRDAEGGLLSVSEGYARSWAVAIRGLGLGIPLISLITMIVGYRRLTVHGITTWDEKNQFTVTHKNLGWVRKFAFVLIIGAFCAALIWTHGERYGY